MGATSSSFGLMSAKAWSKAEMCTQLADNLENKMGHVCNHYRIIYIIVMMMGTGRDWNVSSLFTHPAGH